MRVKLLIVILLSIQSKTGICQSIPTPGLLRQMDSIATQDVPTGAPGIATAIIENGNVIYEKYAGFADLADSNLINSSTRFNIASNGKQFTALAILDLIEKNKIRLTDDIRTWFPDFYPNIKEPITIKTLLNHTSGIRDCYDLWSLKGYTWWEKSFNNSDVLRLLEKQEDLNFTPDSKYLYSNSNYILLALIIEKVSQKTFVEYTHEMFIALNMPNTSFENDYSKIQGNIARAYFNFDTWATYQWIWNVCGDGNIFSTLNDQIQWEKLVQGKGNTTFKRDLIFQSQKTIENSKFTNYGYGLEFGKYKDIAYSFHEGATGAWKATTIRFPEKNISMITLTNTGKSIPSSQTRQMADVIFGLKSVENYLVTKPTAIGKYVSDEEITGTYLTEGDFAFTFEKWENKIYLKRVGRNDVELERETDNIFHQKFDPAFKQEFTTNNNGEMQVTAYYVNHAPYVLTKTKAIANMYDFKGLEGNYYNSETNTTLSIKQVDGVNYEVTFRDDYKTNGLLISGTKMLVDFYSFDFIDSKLLLSGERIRNVKYVRVKN